MAITCPVIPVYPGNPGAHCWASQATVQVSTDPGFTPNQASAALQAFAIWNLHNTRRCSGKEGGLAMKKDEYEVLPADEMRQKYGLVAENRPEIHLDPERVPAKLRHLIPYAELWGVGDDLIREDMIERARPEAIKELKEAVDACEDLLDDWLGGPESYDPNPSEEYIAFSCMRMAAEGG